VPSIIEQIQRDALDRAVSVSDLLRRMKLAATKLGLGAVEDWVEQELNGCKGELPDYRIIHGRPMVQDPYRRVWNRLAALLKSCRFDIPVTWHRVVRRRVRMMPDKPN
jgi:AbiTii